MSTPNSPDLPLGLTHYIPDSDLSVVSWNASESVLILNLEKEIGQEHGRITLSGVSRVCLPPSLQICSHESTTESRFLVDPIEPEELLFIIYGTSWEQPFYVVAGAIAYEVTA